MQKEKYSYNDNINRHRSESAGDRLRKEQPENTEKGMGVKMFGKKKEQTIETNGVVYRREKTWRIALSCFHSMAMSIPLRCSQHPAKSVLPYRQSD